MRCLDAIERTHPPGVEREVLVLDNASGDGSVEAVRDLKRDIRLIALERRTGKGENDSTLLREARGEYCLLLNEDAELQPGAPAALLEALAARPRAAVAGAQLVASDGTPKACAWRLPGVGTALIGAVFLHRLLTVQSGGARTRQVGWAQSSAMLVRREAAEQIGWFDPRFFVYSDEVDFCRRLQDAGWRVLYVPAAAAIHHEQLSTGGVPERRIVEFSRNRDLYMRKHHGPAAALAVRVLTAWSHAARAAVALALPGHDPRIYLLNARQSLFPSRGKGIREVALEHNRRLEVAACRG